MNNLPRIEVSFCVSGKNFDTEQFIKELEIMSTETRDIDDWPDAIKNNLDLPENLRPRYEWCITQEELLCKDVEVPIHKIIAKLEGKEEKLIEFCEKYKVEKGLVIVIHAEAMQLPQIVLSPKTLSYFGKINAEIGFDIYTY